MSFIDIYHAVWRLNVVLDLIRATMVNGAWGANVCSNRWHHMRKIRSNEFHCIYLTNFYYEIKWNECWCFITTRWNISILEHSWNVGAIGECDAGENNLERDMAIAQFGHLSFMKHPNRQAIDCVYILRLWLDCARIDFDCARHHSSANGRCAVLYYDCVGFLSVYLYGAFVLKWRWDFMGPTIKRIYCLSSG